ncbi:MAG TPA: phosphotransferase family protein [Novosphingobium sp.]
MTPAEQAQRIGAWLATCPGLGPDCRLESLVPMAGGQSSELLLAKVERPGKGREGVVIRLEQRGRQLFLTPDIAREFRTIDGVFRAGTVAVPQPLGLEATGDVIGTPFLAMRQVMGEPLLGRPSMHLAGPLPGMAPDQRRAAACNGLDAMAAIHAIDWRSTHPFLAEEGAAELSLDRHLQRVAEWYSWATQGRPFPVTDRAMEYLLENRPPLRDHDPVLLWGDARPGNILFDPDQKVAAVLDWEGAYLGPRALDVGYWLMSDLFHAESIGVARLAGWPTEAETIARYEAASGVKAEDLDYFIVLGCLFMATTLIRAADLGMAAGRLQPGSTMGAGNSLTQIIAQRLGLPIPALSPDFIAHRSLPPGTRGLAG